MSKQVHYRLYCTSEAGWHSIIQDVNVSSPTMCPVNPAHVVNISSLHIFETIDASSQFGSWFDFSENNTEVSSNNKEWEDHLVWNISYLEQGLYRVSWSSIWSLSVANKEISLGLDLNGSLVDSTVESSKTASKLERNNYNNFLYLNLSEGAQTFKLKFKVESIGSANIFSSKIELWRVS